MKKKIWTDQELRRLCHQILDNSYDPKAITVSVEEFQRLYGFVVEATRQVPLLSLVKTLDNEVVAQFSSASPQRFIVTNSSNVTSDSFAFASKKIWHGTKTPAQSFLRFLGLEVQNNFTKLIYIFLPSLFILYFAGSDSLYDLLATLLIQSSTVFFSIYLIFTVTQNQRIAEDSRLFETGITHRYYQDDRNITKLGILTIILTFFNSMVVSLINTLEISPSENINFSAGLKAISTSLVLIFLYDSFLAVSNYYLGRTMDVIERDVIGEILENDLDDKLKVGSNSKLKAK